MGVGIKKQQNRLYIRLPEKIKEEQQIKNLHPNIDIVRLPRQKSRRWCIIEFENKEKLEQARQDLKNIKIEGKYIQVKPFKIPNKQKKV